MIDSKHLLKTGLRANRYFWLVGVAAALCLVGVHLMQHLLILPSFVRMERQAAERDLARCLEAIDREVYHLDKLCGDWSAWDDTYQFVQNKNPAFLAANIDWPTLESMSGLNMIMLFTLAGERIWGESFDSDAGGKVELAEFISPLPEPQRLLLDFSDDRENRGGLLLTSRGPMLVSARPVLRTDGSGPASAILIMGRFLNAQTFHVLAEQTKVPFTVQCLRSDLPLTEEQSRAIQALAENRYALDEISRKELRGFAQIRDVLGKPILLLSASFPRTIFRQGLVTARLAAGAAVAALALIVATVVLWHILRINESRRQAAQIEALVGERTAQLRETRAFLESAVFHSPSGIIIAKAPNLTDRIANPAAREILGADPHTETDVSQATLHWQAYRPDGSPYPVAEMPLSRAIHRGEITRGEELIIRTCSGRERWVLVNAAPILDANSRITAGIVVFHDITSTKRAEEEAQKVQRLRSIGMLAGGIAHDFNNILMALYGNISFAREELPSDHKAYEPLEEAERSLNRAVRLTRQLLTFARGGEPIKEDLSIRQIVEEVARFDLSGSNVCLSVDAPPDLWLVKADKGQIQQVISNLTVNAREAMPDGGHLRISLANVEVGPGDETLRPGRYVRITVRDEGTGISPQDLHRIFDPYFTTKHSGSGLGLATTYSIINRHDGHIGVDSTLGLGTTFTIHLPALATATHDAPFFERQERAPAFQKRRTRILVLDDEAPVRELIASMLTKNGIEAETVADGQAAVERYKEAFRDGTRFDALLMDLTIPGGMGGKEAVGEILAFDPDAKAIVSSGYAVDPVLSRYAEYGFKNRLAKPYSTDELLAVLNQVLGADDGA